MNKKCFILLLFFISSCTSSVVYPPDKINSSATPQLSNSVSPTNTGNNNTDSINDNSKQVISELNKNISDYYISGIKLDQHNNIVLTTDNNYVYKISNFNKLDIYKLDNPLVTPTSFDKSFITLGNDFIQIDESGNGLIFRTIRGYPEPCGFPCTITEQGPEIYKVDNYKIGQLYNRYVYKRTLGEKSERILNFSDPINGKGNISYIDYKTNSIFVAEVNNFDQYQQFKEIKIENQDLKLKSIYRLRNKVIVMAIDEKNQSFNYYTLNYSNLNEIFSYKTTSTNSNPPFFYLKTDINGNETVYLIEPSANNKLLIYSVNNNKVDLRSKKELTNLINLSISYDNIYIDNNGNGIFVYTSTSETEDLNYIIHKISNYQITDKISEIAGVQHILINKDGDGIATKYSSINDRGNSFEKSEVVLIKNYKTSN